MKNIIIVAYDISNDKLRRHFSEFLEKYGVRVQFSVFEIRNSSRVLNIVKQAIETKFKKRFEPGDSIYIFSANRDDIISYGSAALLDNDLIML